jgi:rubrerythrin
MKKVIELLEDALDTMLHVTKLPESYQEVVYVKEALEELKARPRRESVDGDRRVKCNWCESVFYEDYVRVDKDEEQCPVCGEKGYLMDMPEQEKDGGGEKWTK